VTPADVARWIVLPLLGLPLLAAFVRLVRGPSLPDRVVALDLLSGVCIGVSAGLAVATGQALLLDAGLVLALVGFLGTVAFAHYLEDRR